MKHLLLLISLLLCTVAYSQPPVKNYTEAIARGDAAYKRGDYRTAIQHYYAAEAYDPKKRDIVSKKVDAAFDGIDALRIKAEKAQREATQQAEIARKAQTETQTALTQVTTEQARTAAALLTADSALQKAKKAR